MGIQGKPIWIRSIRIGTIPSKDKVYKLYFFPENFNMSKIQKIMTPLTTSDEKDNTGNVVNKRKKNSDFPSGQQPIL